MPEQLCASTRRPWALPGIWMVLEAALGLGPDPASHLCCEALALGCLLASPTKSVPHALNWQAQKAGPGTQSFGLSPQPCRLIAPRQC